MQTHLQKFSTPTESIFARGMDDFIFVTIKREMAQEFLQRMHMGFPDYHCEIQTSKTATNLTDDIDGIHTV